MLRAFSGICLCLALFTGARAQEVMPPAPARHFHDEAGLVSPAVAQRLDAELDEFERATSNQLLVAIYPRMQSDSSVADYTQRIAQSWHAGTKGRNNGAILFIFSQEHRLYIQTGYGLEGVLPDALCKRIVDDVIVPHFKQRDFDGGVTAGVHAMIAATKGEYTGDGATIGDRRHSFNPFPFIVLIIVIASAIGSRRRRSVYGRRGRNTIWWTGGGWGGGGGGGWGGGGGGGGFSGGGGSFGGGGAGGSW